MRPSVTVAVSAMTGSVNVKPGLRIEGESTKKKRKENTSFYLFICSHLPGLCSFSLTSYWEFSELRT